MKTIEGLFEYATDGVGVDGCERFHIDCLADGSRLLRAHSEMHNDRVMRETLVIVDRQWRPKLAQMHLTLDDHYVGAGQYRFSTDSVSFDGHTVRRGQETISSALDAPVPAFSGHALQNDAWLFAASDRERAIRGESPMSGVVVTSKLPNGADGPTLIFSEHRHRLLGEEVIVTAAGRFDTRHYEFLFDGRPSIHYWITGDDYVVVRARWDLLNQSYELVSLEES